MNRVALSTLGTPASEGREMLDLVYIVGGKMLPGFMA